MSKDFIKRQTANRSLGWFPMLLSGCWRSEKQECFRMLLFGFACIAAGRFGLEDTTK